MLRASSRVLALSQAVEFIPPYALEQQAQEPAAIFAQGPEDFGGRRWFATTARRPFGDDRFLASGLTRRLWMRMHPQLFKQICTEYQDKMSHMCRTVSASPLPAITEWH